MSPDPRAPHPPADALHRLPDAWTPLTAPTAVRTRHASARPVPPRPHPSRASRRARAFALALILLVLALVVAAVAIPGVRGALAPTVQRVLPSLPSGGLASGGMWSGSPTEADGYIATGESVAVDDESAPAVANLDPDLRAAVQAAAAAAADDGHDLVLTSGWRSEDYQRWLFDKAVRHYGSEEEARRWVATPQSSAHVSGSAVDVGPWETTLWMQSHAEQFGLCQIYANEMWHYELRSRYGGSCPALREDAAG